MTTTTDTKLDTFRQLRDEWDAAESRLEDAREEHRGTRLRMFAIVEEHLRDEHPLVLEGFGVKSSFPPRVCARTGEVVEDGDRWWVIYRHDADPFGPSGGIPFATAERAETALAALREVPTDLLDAWAYVTSD